MAYMGSTAAAPARCNSRATPIPSPSPGSVSAAFGVSTIDAKGEVYNLARVSDFPGAYGQGRYGAVGRHSERGDLWLENPNGVVMHLKAKREGLMLSLGGDAVVVTMQ